MSEMVDSSYKMFDGLGKFWQGRNDAVGARMKPSSSSNSNTSGGMMEEMKRQVNRVRASSIAESELKDMAATEDRHTNKVFPSIQTNEHIFSIFFLSVYLVEIDPWRCTPSTFDGTFTADPQK